MEGPVRLRRDFVDRDEAARDRPVGLFAVERPAARLEARAEGRVKERADEAERARDAEDLAPPERGEVRWEGTVLPTVSGLRQVWTVPSTDRRFLRQKVSAGMS
jgi:hypothetical protein